MVRLSGTTVMTFFYEGLTALVGYFERSFASAFHLSYDYDLQSHVFCAPRDSHSSPAQRTISSSQTTSTSWIEIPHSLHSSARAAVALSKLKPFPICNFQYVTLKRLARVVQLLDPKELLLPSP